MTYTADAVALLAYLVDALPERADRLFAEAEAGETAIQTPSTALAEALYSVSRDKDIRDVTLTGTPADARRALVDSGPVSLAAVGDAELVRYVDLVNDLTIHDALVVASHRARGTDAIITSDSAIRDAVDRVIWD